MPEHTIALDAMSGDQGIAAVVPAAVRAWRESPGLRLILVGDEARVLAALQRAGATPDDRLQIHHASQVVEMSDPVAHALRAKRDSSMRVAINLVREGTAQACVSAGNTGALMATARYVLKTLPGIDRPAICTALPSIEGHTHVLDLGANVDCQAEHLFQFAVMGGVLARALDGKPAPRIGLLNIGEEDIKGNEQVKQAAALLTEAAARHGLNYIGFVEGDDVYVGGADVVVCDGFVGNVALKTSEGVARMISHYMKQEFRRNPLTRLAGLAALPVLRSFRRRIDPRRYNGASLLGLKGIVIKSHGGADALAFGSAIGIARSAVDQDLPGLIRSRLEELFGVEEPA